MAKGQTLMVWLWDILLPNIEWSRHHSVSFFAVKCRKNGYFHTFLGCKCFKTAVMDKTLIVWLWDMLMSKIEWSRCHLVSFFAVKCRKHGYFHTFWAAAPKAYAFTYGGLSPSPTIFATVSFVIRNMWDTKKTKKQINLS